MLCPRHKHFFNKSTFKRRLLQCFKGISVSNQICDGHFLCPASGKVCLRSTVEYKALHDWFTYAPVTHTARSWSMYLIYLIFIGPNNNRHASWCQFSIWCSMTATKIWSSDVQMPVEYQCMILYTQWTHEQNICIKLVQCWANVEYFTVRVMTMWVSLHELTK